jgi:glycosidase
VTRKTNFIMDTMDTINTAISGFPSVMSESILKNHMENHFPSWAKNLTIYEVNLRQYTPGGTIAEFRQHLPRLRELGIGILWFMPIQPIGTTNRKGSLGSYYSIRDYCKVDPLFGTLKEFSALVEEIHSMGMFVILDWVANHTAWDHHWVNQHFDYYRKNEYGDVYPPFPDWADVVGLDYSNPGMRKSMIEAMKYWLVNTGIDGFRCDMAHLVPTDFWEQARPELESTREGIYMLAETDHYDLLKNAFHSSYDWKVFHAINEVAQGQISVSELAHTIEDQLRWYPTQSALMRFISNHDENSWQGSEIERLTYALEPMTILYFTLPGIPLIYSGQEAGNYRRLSFFEKDMIEWKEDKMAVLFSKLTALRKANPALWSDGTGFGYKRIITNNDETILAFERVQNSHAVLVILNLSYDTCKFNLLGELSSDSYRDLFDGELQVRFGMDPCFELKPFGYKVFYR